MLPNIFFEPINVPKMAVLVVGTFSFIPILLLLIRERVAFNLNKWIIPSIMIILFCFLVSLVMSQAPITQSFWGIFGRNTGLLTISCLILLFIAGYLLAKSEKSVRVMQVFVLVSIPSSIYGLIQFLGQDPFPWVQSGVFSSLGNSNFASSFFALVSIASFGLYRILKKRNYSELYLLTCIMNIFLTVVSGSIQGPIILIIAVTILPLIKVTKVFGSFIGILYLTSLSAIGAYFVWSLFGFGPLGERLYQQTLSLRLDYWRAGLRMIGDSPLFGKGPDAYGDWYRRERDLEAILKTSAGRVTNTAHNIFIDIGVSAGVVAMVLTFIFFFLPIISFLKKILQRQKIRTVDLVLLLLVIGYFMQALISINQISLAVWGWLFGGMLLGAFENVSIRNHDLNKTRQELEFKSDNSRDLPLPPNVFLQAVLSGAIGLLLIIPPSKADIDFQVNYQSQDLNRLLSISRSLGSNAVHMETTLELMRTLAPQVQSLYAMEIVSRFPTSVYAWKRIHDLNAPGSRERLQAVDKFIELDPLNPETWTQKWMASPPGSIGRREAISRLKVLDPDDVNTFVGWKKLESWLNCTQCQIYPAPG
jgi:O-antigen ligase